MEPRNYSHQIQSEVISLMRFPLIVLVVFIHVLPEVCLKIDSLGSGSSYYLFFSELLSHSIGRIAVPAFFVISGYFFFFKMKEWSGEYYESQLWRRFFSLVLPFLLWNLIAVFSLYLKFVSFEALGIPQSEPSHPLSSPDFLSILWSGPANYPLWYMRDLICMVILTPCFYYLFKYLKGYGLILLYIFYLLNVEIGLKGLSSTALLYFGAGAYLGIFKKNFLALAMRFRFIALPLALLLPLATTWMYGRSEMYEHLMRIYIPLGLMAFVCCIYYIRQLQGLQLFLKKVEKYVFFIYVSHSFLIIGWVKGAFSRIPFMNNHVLGSFLSYLLIPVVTIGVCILLYIVWNKVSSKSLSFVLGGRVS